MATVAAMLLWATLATSGEPPVIRGMVESSLARLPPYHLPAPTLPVVELVTRRYERLLRVRQRFQIIRGARWRLETRREQFWWWPLTSYAWVSEWA